MVIAGRYELLEQVGLAASSPVYRAIDRTTQAVVLIKFLRAQGPEYLARLFREAELLAQLHHPGCVAYLDHGTDEQGRPFVATEWLVGKTLFDRLAEGPLRVDETLALGRRVAEVLVDVHAQGIVHRDLKPSNLFLTGGDARQVKLLDFGVAHCPQAQPLTRTGQLLGTPGYMAPEQARGRRRLDGRTDLFALGCVLYECLAGRPAFTGTDVVVLLARLILEHPPAVETLVPGVPDDLAALIEKLLSKEPDERPADARAVVDALDRVRAGSGSRRSSGSRSTPSNERGAPPAGPMALVLALPEIANLGRVTLEGDLPTLVDDDVALPEELTRAIGEQGGELNRTADGTLICTVPWPRKPKDLPRQVERAAQCALTLRGHFEGLLVALVVTTVTGEQPTTPQGQGVADLIQRAGRLLLRAELYRDEADGQHSRAVRLDKTARALLGPGFQITEETAGPALWAASGPASSPGPDE